RPVAVDAPWLARFPVAAVVRRPGRPLGLGFLRAEGQGVADGASPERLGLAGGPREIVPRLRRSGDAGPGEQVLVGEACPGAREGGEPVELAPGHSPPRERLEGALLGLRRQ